MPPEEYQKALDEAQKEVVVPEEEEAEEVEEIQEEESEAIELDDISEEEDSFEEQDGEEEEEPDEAEAEEPAKPAQTPEENAQWAQRRREAEQKAKEKTDKLNKILKPYGVETLAELDEQTNANIDPKTLERLKNEALEKGYDEEDYIDRYAMKKKVNMLLAQKEAEKAERERAQALAEKTRLDIEEFAAVYPKDDFGKLLKDEDFIEFADGKWATNSPTQLYARYRKFKGIDKAAELQKAVSRAERTTGSGKSPTIMLSAKDQEALNDFNKSAPEKYRMTPAQYLSYKKGD